MTWAVRIAPWHSGPGRRAGTEKRGRGIGARSCVVNDVNSTSRSMFSTVNPSALADSFNPLPVPGRKLAIRRFLLLRQRLRTCTPLVAPLP